MAFVEELSQLQDGRKVLITGKSELANIYDMRFTLRQVGLRAGLTVECLYRLIDKNLNKLHI